MFVFERFIALAVEVPPTAVAATAPRANDSAAAATITRRRPILGFARSAFSSGMV